MFGTLAGTAMCHPFQPLVLVIEPEAVGVPGTRAQAMCFIQSSPDRPTNLSAGYQPLSG